MSDRQVFEEMIRVYRKAIPEMKLLGEVDWCNAARETLRRLFIHFHKSTISPIQLARECHADLQGYVQVRFDADLLDAESCRDEGCFDLYMLGQHLAQMGGYP
jgi:hypothetical protein